jgi:hypothetical protein
MRIFMICATRKILLGLSNQGMIEWARHMAHMEAKGNTYRVLVAKPEGKDHSVDLGADGGTILKFLSEKEHPLTL